MAATKQKVTNEQVHRAYDKAKYVYEHPKRITKAKAALDLHLNEKINKGTANDFLRVFQHLLEGTTFKRALSKYAMDYFLFNIKNDFGDTNLQECLSALMSHILYREEGDIDTGRKAINQKAMREVHKKFSDLMAIQENELNTVEANDEYEQEDASKQMSTTYETKEDIKQAISRYEKQSSDKATISSTTYKRHNVVISLIKNYRDYKCQICKISIVKADGSEYIEAAHITPHHLGGKATLRNIILLCPNHHKEFDLGKRIITRGDNEDLLEITLNGKTHKLILS